MEAVIDIAHVIISSWRSVVCK